MLWKPHKRHNIAASSSIIVKANGFSIPPFLAELCEKLTRVKGTGKTENKNTKSFHQVYLGGQFMQKLFNG